MKPYIRSIRSALAEAPSTSVELSLVLGITPRRARVGLWILKTQGFVRNAGTVLNREYPRRGQRRLFQLYALTRRGVAIGRRAE